MSRFELYQYAQMLDALSGSNFVLGRDFANTKGNCIFLRHDIDSLDDDILKIAHCEIARSIRSTFFVKSAFIDNREMMTDLMSLESMGFEIGLHNDCLSRAEGDNGKNLLTDALKRMAAMGFHVSGISNHGDGKLRAMGKNNNDVLPHNLGDINIQYEAYHLNYTYYVSDIGVPGKLKVYRNMVCPEKSDKNPWFAVIPEYLKIIKNERVEILVHPQHWE